VVREKRLRYLHPTRAWLNIRDFGLTQYVSLL